MTRLKAIIENIRTNGKDPVYRKSMYISMLGHAMVLLVIPWLVHLKGGCAREPRPLPEDWDGAKTERTRVYVSTFVPDDKKIISRKDENSPIIWVRPTLEDSPIPDEVEQETLDQYKTVGKDIHKRPGTPGGRGTSRGFPGGWSDGKVHFIRLEYSGEEWDDGMDSREGADKNFLNEFRRLTGVSRIASRGESHPIRDLARYHKGEAPPFVYMTGSGSINGVSSRDMEILRDYIRRGGMLFADCGSPAWHRSFMAFARRLWPGVEFKPISDDDPIFRQPFLFADGAPSLWHHGGYKAMGMKVQGRWAVFYHPGDMNDAWKNGRSGITPDLAKAAHRMGVNVVWYACRNYADIAGRHRKRK